MWRIIQNWITKYDLIMVGDNKMKVGYIRRTTDYETGKETFKYIEGNATRRIGARTDSVKVKFLYGTTPYEEIKSNTEDISDASIMIVGEPFFTDDALKERAEKWCEWANSCEHREYSSFGEGITYIKARFYKQKEMKLAWRIIRSVGR